LSILGVDERRVTNTYQAVDHPGRAAGPQPTTTWRMTWRSSSARVRGDTFLFYGAIEPKKNVSRMVDAYAASGKQAALDRRRRRWMAESGGSAEDPRRTVSSTFGIDGDIVRRQRQIRPSGIFAAGPASSLDFGAAGTLLFPSIYEGFGLPVIEAMALGTPVRDLECFLLAGGLLATLHYS